MKYLDKTDDKTNAFSRTTGTNLNSPFIHNSLCVVIKGLRNVNDVWRASIFPPFDI